MLVIGVGLYSEDHGIRPDFRLARILSGDNSPAIFRGHALNDGDRELNTDRGD